MKRPLKFQDEGKSIIDVCDVSAAKVSINPRIWILFKSGNGIELHYPDYAARDKDYESFVIFLKSQ